MRVVFDINFGTTGKQTHFGIFDYETNTLEYISQTKLETKVKKGYVVQDLALQSTVESNVPTIDILHTIRQNIPFLQKSLTDQPVGSGNKSCLILTQPIYMKDLRTGFYFIYKNVTFAYQKRKQSNEWGVVLPTGMTVENGVSIIYQLAPYLLCGDVFKIRFSNTTVDALDFSSLAQLSDSKLLDLSINNTSVYKKVSAVRIAGLMQNLRFSSLFNGLLAEDDNLTIIDLCNIYSDKKTDITNSEFFSYSWNIPSNSLLFLPNIDKFVDYTIEGYKHSHDTKRPIEWLNLGRLSKNSDYINETKKQIAKYKLMGKNPKDYIFYATVI